MPDLEQRVTRLEERSDAHTRMIDMIRSDIGDLRHSVDALRTELHVEISGVRAEIGGLRSEIDRRFTWLVGIQVASLVATIGVLVGAYYRP